MTRKNPPAGLSCHPALRPEPETIARHVGGRIRRRRRLGLGLTQRALEHIAGCPPGAIGRTERGVDALAAGHLYGLAAALGVEVDYFFQGLDFLEHTALADKVGKKAQARELERFLEAYAAIPDPQVRQTLFDLLVSLAMEPLDANNG